MERIHYLFDKNAWKDRIPMVVRNIWGEKALAIPALSYCYAAYMRFCVGLDERERELLDGMVYSGFAIWAVWFAFWMVICRLLTKSWTWPWRREPEDPIHS